MYVFTAQFSRIVHVDVRISKLYTFYRRRRMILVGA